MRMHLNCIEEFSFLYIKRIIFPRHGVLSGYVSAKIISLEHLSLIEPALKLLA